MISTDAIKSLNFRKDPEDPVRFERYQAEALVQSHVPVSALYGIICYTEQIKQGIDQQIQARGLSLPVHARKSWYFT